MKTLSIDKKLLTAFEEGLDPRHPDRSTIPAEVLGYGEMSTVFAVGKQGHRDLAYKRMPIFLTKQEVARYETIYNEYNEILKDRVGIEVPAYDAAVIETNQGRLVMFDVQKRLLADSIGNRAIHTVSPDQVRLLVRLVLRELKKVWVFNARKTGLEIGIDGQISNWSVVGFDPKDPKVTEKSRLIYFDTSTPFIKKKGTEQLDPELFLRAAPSFLVWLIRWLFLADVMTRYYSFHLVAVDLVANFYKEQRPELIPGLVAVVNDFFATEAKELAVEPISENEVASYYKEDAWIWRLWLAFRRIDRFLKTRILMRSYPFILPGKIKR
jgi:hypothetical protein